MKKSKSIGGSDVIPEALRVDGFEPCYLGYFERFNSQRYYEAHEFLELLWLKEGREAPDYAFFKGLIQMAGGFVHLKLQHAHPGHPSHGRRLHPARRLFLLAMENLAPYGPIHHGIDPRIPAALCDRFASRIMQAGFSRNPWSPDSAPILPLPELQG